MKASVAKKLTEDSSAEIGAAEIIPLIVEAAKNSDTTLYFETQSFKNPERMIRALKILGYSVKYNVLRPSGEISNLRVSWD